MDILINKNHFITWNFKNIFFESQFYCNREENKTQLYKADAT